MTEQTKRNVTIITIIGSLMVPLLILSPAISTSVSSKALYLSAVIGYMGIVLLLWMYMLGTRAVTGLIFHDIAPILSIHKWLGKFAIPMIFLHPLLITLSYGEGLFYSILPKIGSVTERHILLGQIALGILVFTWVTSAFLRGKIKFRPWKYLHYLAYIALPFALLHVPDLGTQERTHIIVKAFLGGLVVVFGMFTLLRLRSLLNFDKTTYLVTDMQLLNDTDAVITIAPESKMIQAPQPGQYIYIKLGYLSEDHPFSVLWYDEVTHQLTLGFRATGMYTKEIRKLQKGNITYVSGPYGTFTHEIITKNNDSPVFIAGGIGITPFVQHLFTHPNSILLYANRNKRSSLLYSELRKQLGGNMHSTFNDEPDRDEAYEHLGYINADLVKQVVPVFHEKHFYICGPAAMMNAVIKELTSLGIDEHQIHTEEFGW
jgi:predicted ferric reductase